MRPKSSLLRTVEEIVAEQLCCGCGACAYIAPDEFEMTDVISEGRRPRRRSGGSRPSSSRDETQAVEVCPGVRLERGCSGSQEQGALLEWGPILEIWEGYATDPEIRFAGSSGGISTALSLFAVEKLGLAGVLHTGQRPDAPHLNRSVFSSSRSELLQATGSRYSPASPCEALRSIENASGACLFVGKPCDVAAANRAAALRPGLRRNLGLTLAFFCAGTPSTAGTLSMLSRMGFDDPAAVREIRFRGNGWPGAAIVKGTLRGESHESRLSYQECWDQILQEHRPWRCHICPDHTGEFADLAVGDPWHLKADQDDPFEAGQSIVVVRSERGRNFLEQAIRAGYVTLRRGDVTALDRSQPNLRKARAKVWGRLMALRLCGAGVPEFVNFGLKRSWNAALSNREKIQSVLGSLRRISKRRFGRPASANDTPHPG